ncbi:streptococcal hemagglutinin-like [Dermacentor albipictus]|uniref:streptococcal hemagglutinin-like n=1 Tax=Dermacentor albipictus TaxID=60249 RepID=UPI0031FD8CA1
MHRRASASPNFPVGDNDDNEGIFSLKKSQYQQDSENAEATLHRCIMYSPYSSPRGSRYASTSRPFSASVSPVHTPSRRFMSPRMKLMPGSATTYRLPSSAYSPPPTYSRSGMQPVTASSSASPTGSLRSLTMVARPRDSAVDQLQLSRSWSRSPSRSRSRSASMSLSPSRHSRSRIPWLSPRRSSSVRSSSSRRSQTMDTEVKTSAPIIELPPGLDRKTAGYWVMALAIFCLASSCALVATLLNRTAASQDSFGEERYLARKEPSLQLHERTRGLEDLSVEVHFARRKTPKAVTLRTPPFFFITTRPRRGGTPALFPRTVPAFPEEYPAGEETLAEYPATVPERPGDYETPPYDMLPVETEAPYVRPATVEPHVDIDNSTGSQGDAQGNVTESAGETSDTKASEKENEGPQSPETIETATNVVVESSPSAEVTTEVASSEGITEASRKEVEPSTSAESASAGETEAESSTSAEATSASETDAEPSTEKATEKSDDRHLNEYDDDNFNMLQKVRRAP